MMLDAMRSIHAEGVSCLDAHPDLEVFRLRLGKALNYEFHEDSQTGLFQRRDPRECAWPSWLIKYHVGCADNVHCDSWPCTRY